VRIAEMTVQDYAAVMDLMRRTPEMRIREADSKEAVEKYLLRNPGLSFVAWDGDKLIGCAMSGHGGRRGYLQHVVTDSHYRGQGIAHELVTRCLDKLEGLGILKTHIDVFITNENANTYWLRRGWRGGMIFIVIPTTDRKIPMLESDLTASGSTPRWRSDPARARRHGPPRTGSVRRG
jgi:ribosomal protein S18 acetylase RimI-like enzyme